MQKDEGSGVECLFDSMYQLALNEKKVESSKLKLFFCQGKEIKKNQCDIFG